MAEQAAVTEAGTYAETSSWGLDHPNVKRMDNFFLVTMNNEHIKRGYIPSSQVELVKDDVEIMASMEFLFATHVDVETARAVRAGEFTLMRAIESSRDGFFTRMEHSQYNYEATLPVTKQKGFLGGLFNRHKDEQPVYRADRPYQQ